LLLAAFSSALGATRAGEIETRDFAVLVGGKAAGEVHMTIHKQDSGAISVRTDTDVKVTVGLLTHKYSYRGLEVWKDSRLVKLDSTCEENSKRVTVSAAAGDAGVTVKSNGVEKVIKAEAWVSTYWTLPGPKLREGEITILDADSGKELTARLQYVATEKMRVAGQEVSLNHYRLTGKVTADLWYDGHDRLVRQEWTESGHKTIMVLVRVRR
jgi:hypothetical protein